MPLSIESAQSPGPISTDQAITVDITDPDGAADGPMVYVMALFDDGSLENLVYEGVGQGGYTMTSDDPAHQTIERTGGWPCSFNLLLIGSNIYPAPFQSATLRFRIAAGVLNNPIAQEMALMRDVIEAITPLGAPEVAFVRCVGSLPLAEEPAIGERLFEVALDAAAPVTDVMMAERSRQATRRVHVRVRYDGLSDLVERDEIMQADDDAIIWALETGGNASGVQLVQFESATTTEDASGFAVRDLVFAITYVTHNNPG